MESLRCNDLPGSQEGQCGFFRSPIWPPCVIITQVLLTFAVKTEPSPDLDSLVAGLCGEGGGAGRFAGPWQVLKSLQSKDAPPPIPQTRCWPVAVTDPLAQP